VLAQIERHYYSAIEIDTAPNDPISAEERSRFSAAFMRTLLSHYRPGRLRPFRRSPSLPCSEAMALTRELKDHTVVDEPVNDDAGGHRVREHLGPVCKGQVRRYSDACAFITLRDDLVK
jgi:hypothetical protein